MTRNYEVDSVRLVEISPLIDHGERELTDEWDITERQFLAEGELVDILQEAGSKLAMHLDAGPDDTL